MKNKTMSIATPYNELISKDECLKIIKTVMGETQSNELNLELRNFEYEIVPASSEVMGYLGEYYNLRTVIRKSKKSKGKLLEFFIKVLPVTNELNRNLVDELNIFPKEVRFYTELFKEMAEYSSSRWHCKCYYTRPDLLVFENLILFDYRNLHDDEKFTDFHLQTTLKCMAEMHCSSIVLETRGGFNIGEKYESSLHEITLDDKTGWFPAGLKALQAVTAKIPKYKNMNVADLVPDPYAYGCLNKFMDASDKYWNVFCHRDIWNRNILFRYNENDDTPREAILVDFQNCRYCPPAVDFMMFLILNQTSAERKKKFAWCTKYYHDNLRECLTKHDIDIEQILEFDDFLESCTYVQLAPLVFKTIYMPFTNAPDKYFFNNLRTTDPVRYDHYLKRDRTECVLKFVNEDEKFRNLFYEAASDVVECYTDLRKQNLL